MVKGYDPYLDLPSASNLCLFIQKDPKAFQKAEILHALQIQVYLGPDTFIFPLVFGVQRNIFNIKKNQPPRRRPAFGFFSVSPDWPHHADVALRFSSVPPDVQKIAFKAQFRSTDVWHGISKIGQNSWHIQRFVNKRSMFQNKMFVPTILFHSKQKWQWFCGFKNSKS